jgi:hypothetical protein
MEAPQKIKLGTHNTSCNTRLGLLFLVGGHETTLRIVSGPNFAKIVNLDLISRVIIAVALVGLCFCAGAFAAAETACLDLQTIKKRKWLHFRP